MNQYWSVSLDGCIARRLRECINQEANIAIQSRSTLKDKRMKKLYPAWNRICVLMDRIEDTAAHINNMRIRIDNRGGCAFEFIDLLNHSSILIDCIFEMARVFDVDYSVYAESSAVFHEVGKDGEGNDKQYFEYLRSICAVHPFETSHHKRYQNYEFECCPFVCWNNMRDDIDSEIYAQIYLSNDDMDHYKDLPIYLNQIKSYIEKIYNSIASTIIPGIIQYQEEYKNRYRVLEMKKEKDFLTYVEYLQYLKNEHQIRFGDDNEYLIDYAILFFQARYETQQNKALLEKYQNILKKAIHFHHHSLQYVSYDGYENNGILYCDPHYETTLLHLLYSLNSQSEMAKRYSYELSKAYELYEPTMDSAYARMQLEHARPFLAQYISFEEADTDARYYVLVQLAKYADCLKVKNRLNANIPNEQDYRFKLLTEKEWEDLHR